MRILGIDPGYGRCGVAVVETSNEPARDASVLFSTCVQTDKNKTFDERLGEIVGVVKNTIKKYSPTHCAIEDLFFGANKTTGLKVAEVRGAIRALALSNKIPVHEYKPSEIKIALTGSGSASKEMVTRMVRTLSDFDNDVLDDEYDAIAVAITGLVSLRQS